MCSLLMKTSHFLERKSRNGNPVASRKEYFARISFKVGVKRSLKIYVNF